MAVLIRGKWMEVMGAASAGSAGSKGAVPAPSAGEDDEFLRGDATFATPSGGPSSYYPGPWGDGADGLRSILSSTSNSAGIFRYTNLTLASSVVWTITGGFTAAIIYVNGTLTLNTNAKIVCQTGGSGGSAGSGGTSGSKNGTSGSSPSGDSTYWVSAGGGGGGGGSGEDDGGGAGGDGGDGGDRGWTFADPSTSSGGAGGSGGGIGGNVGGSASAPIARSPAYYYMFLDSILSGIRMRGWGAPGGGGGGGGYGPANGGNGFAGGDGGGNLWIFANTLIMYDGSEISVAGADGGSAGFTVVGGGGGGGGGGAGGSLGLFVGNMPSNSYNTGTAQPGGGLRLVAPSSGTATLNYAGGSGGSGAGSSGAYSGGAGSDGEHGRLMWLKWSK